MPCKAVTKLNGSGRRQIRQSRIIVPGPFNPCGGLVSGCCFERSDSPLLQRGARGDLQVVRRKRRSSRNLHPVWLAHSAWRHVSAPRWSASATARTHQKTCATLPSNWWWTNAPANLLPPRYGSATKKALCGGRLKRLAGYGMHGKNSGTCQKPLSGA